MAFDIVVVVENVDAVVNFVDFFELLLSVDSDVVVNSDVVNFGVVKFVIVVVKVDFLDVYHSCSICSTCKNSSL